MSPRGNSDKSARSTSYRSVFITFSPGPSPLTLSESKFGLHYFSATRTPSALRRLSNWLLITTDRILQSPREVQVQVRDLVLALQETPPVLETFLSKSLATWDGRTAGTMNSRLEFLLPLVSHLRPQSWVPFLDRILRPLITIVSLHPAALQAQVLSL